jgi:acyl-CoA thioester hydrolase
MSAATLRHRIAVTVRHADLDPNDHVTNSVICAWFDDGRYRLLREHLFPLCRAGLYFALVDLSIGFRAEVGFADQPRVATGVTRLGRSSIAMRQELWCAGRLCCTATSVTVMADRALRRSVALQAEQRTALGRFAASGLEP